MSYKFLPAVFQTPGRVSIDFIAVHWMATTLAGCDATFTGGQRPASAHYGIENKVIHQYVKDGNTAWALGDWDANQRSISIEHSAGPGRPATDETYETSIELIASKCGEYGLEPSHDTIRPHNHFQATQCPGTMDLDRIIHGVQKLLNTTLTDDERFLVELFGRV